MKKINILKILIVIVNLVFAVMSFGPCFKGVSISMLPFPDFEATTSFRGYYPENSCVIIAIEFLLLILKNNKVRIVGIILNLFKTFAPIMLSEFLEMIISPISGRHSYTWSLEDFGKVIIAVGCVVTVLYIVEFISSIKSAKEGKNEQ